MASLSQVNLLLIFLVIGSSMVSMMIMLITYPETVWIQVPQTSKSIWNIVYHSIEEQAHSHFQAGGNLVTKLHFNPFHQKDEEQKVVVKSDAVKKVSNLEWMK